MYVLLLILAGSSAAAFQSVEFESKELCKRAKVQLEKSTSYASYRTLECLKIKE